MEIIALLKASIHHKKGSFFSILFLMFLITASFASVISIYDNINCSYENAAAKADIGDLVSYISDKYYTDELEASLLAEPNTKRVRDMEFIYIQEYKIDGKNVSNNLLNLCEWVDGKYTVMNDSLTGIDHTARQPALGEVYVPVCMKSIAGCDIGSTLTIETKDGNEDFTITGFIEEPLTGAFVITAKQAFINNEDYTRLYDHEIDASGQKGTVLSLYHMIHLYHTDSCDLTPAEYKRAINQNTSLIRFSYTTLSKEDSKYYTMLFNTIGIDILYVFIAFLFVIVLIIMGHSITTGIEMDYVNYGILKAVGFTKKKLRLVIYIQYMLALVIGAITGVFGSLILNHLMSNIFLSITGIYTTTGLSVVKSMLGILAVLILCFLFILVKSRSIGKISPVKAITGNREEIYFSDRLFLPVKKSCLHLTLALRQLTSNKKQYLASTAIAALLVFFLMCMTIMTRCITANGISQTYGGTICDVKAVANTALTSDTLTQIEDSISKISPLSEIQYIAKGYVLVDDYQYNSESYMDTSLLKNIFKGRAPEYENEIAVTETVARELQKSIGDTVTVSRKDASYEFLITGYVQTTTEAGRYVLFSLDGFQRLESEFELTGCYTLSDASKIAEVIDMLNQTYGSVLEAKEYDDGDIFLSTFEHSLTLTTCVIYSISGLFAFVTILMISKKAFLKEQHDIGVYKALGFTVASLRHSFAIRFMIIALTGSWIGLLFGYLFNEPLLGAMLTVTGITSFHTTYTLFTFLAPVALVCGCYYIFSYLISYKIKAVSVRRLITE